jgi:hypothetical protein
MDVHKARGDDATGGVDLLLAPPGHGADRGDPAIRYGHVGKIRFAAAAIDQQAASNDKVILPLAAHPDVLAYSSFEARNYQISQANDIGAAGGERHIPYGICSR